MQLRLPWTVQSALAELAARERRDPKAQAELIIIRTLIRRGLLRHDWQHDPDIASEVRS